MAQKPMYEGINNSPITALDGDLSASATSRLLKPVRNLYP